ncbi:hypothetical protein IF1G_01968 [Cordyceps javanica]|uniref:Uncharacterized protein n=1 Tax=Cordyceps javanica TaxID=43265 RepID=A0A545VDF0_9HYPO|nr:hypothetical protein IF1G_01968 [Cordyceps javanica]
MLPSLFGLTCHNLPWSAAGTGGRGRGCCSLTNKRISTSEPQNLPTCVLRWLRNGEDMIRSPLQATCLSIYRGWRRTGWRAQKASH